jgi:hypothetical protein
MRNLRSSLQPKRMAPVSRHGVKYLSACKIQIQINRVDDGHQPRSVHPREEVGVARQCMRICMQHQVIISSPGAGRT